MCSAISGSFEFFKLYGSSKKPKSSHESLPCAAFRQTSRRREEVSKKSFWLEWEWGAVRHTAVLIFATYSPSCPLDGESRAVPTLCPNPLLFIFFHFSTPLSFFNPLSVAYLMLCLISPTITYIFHLEIVNFFPSNYETIYVYNQQTLVW